MMDNTKCKDQCQEQDDALCEWSRDLNDSGKLLFDKCITPSMELKGNGNKELKEPGIVYVVFGLMLQALLLLSEFLSVDFMSRNQDRTQMITEEAFRILLMYLTLELLADMKYVLVMLMRDIGNIITSYFQVLLGDKGIGRKGNEFKPEFKKGQISLREDLDMRELIGNYESRPPQRIFITGSHDEDGKVGPSPVIRLEGPPWPEECFVSSLESTRVDDQIFDVNWTSEIKDKAIIDSGCSKSVAGSTWFEGFMETLSDQDKKAILKLESNAKFKFGGHGIYHSQALVTAPVYVGGKRIFIRFDVVETDIPLLISLKVMKKLEMNMHLLLGNLKLTTIQNTPTHFEKTAT